MQGRKHMSPNVPQSLDFNPTEANPLKENENLRLGYWLAAQGVWSKRNLGATESRMDPREAAARRNKKQF